MKRTLFSLSLLLFTFIVKAQTTDSTAVVLDTLSNNTPIVDSVLIEEKKPLTEYERDSVLSQICSKVGDIVYLKTEGGPGRYKLIPTNNTYTLLKLDTATGEVTAIQIGMNRDSYRMEYSICSAVETSNYFLRVGRFDLYPTGNMYNFVLIDTMFGQTWQVQWSTKSSECGKWRIY